MKRGACARCEVWKSLFEAWRINSEKKRATMDWCEDKLMKALRVKYTRAQLVSIIKCVSHALSDSPRAGNPRLRRPR